MLGVVEENQAAEGTTSRKRARKDYACHTKIYKTFHYILDKSNSRASSIGQRLFCILLLHRDRCYGFRQAQYKRAVDMKTFTVSDSKKCTKSDE